MRVYMVNPHTYDFDWYSLGWQFLPCAMPILGASILVQVCFRGRLAHNILDVVCTGRHAGIVLQHLRAKQRLVGRSNLEDASLPS